MTPSTYQGHQILCLTTNLQRILNCNNIINTNFSKQGLTTNLWKTPITKNISSATAYAFSFSDILHIYPPLDLLHHNNGLQSLIFKMLTVNQKTITYKIKFAYILTLHCIQLLPANSPTISEKKIMKSNTKLQSFYWHKITIQNSFKTDYIITIQSK